MDVNLKKCHILYHQPLVLSTEGITAGAIKLKTPPLLYKCSIVIKIIMLLIIALFSLVQFSRSVISNSLRPHGLQHARLHCPSPSPGICPNPWPLCYWKRVFAMTSAFSWQKSISLCPASFCSPRSNVPVMPGISWLPTFAFQSPIVKRTIFGGVSSRRSCRSS